MRSIDRSLARFVAKFTFAATRVAPRVSFRLVASSRVVVVVAADRSHADILETCLLCPFEGYPRRIILQRTTPGPRVPDRLSFFLSLSLPLSTHSSICPSPSPFFGQLARAYRCKPISRDHRGRIPLEIYDDPSRASSSSSLRVSLPPNSLPLLAPSRDSPRFSWFPSGLLSRSSCSSAPQNSEERGVSFPRAPGTMQINTTSNPASSFGINPRRDGDDATRM